MTHDEVWKFWFQDIDKDYWFRKDAKFDQTLRERFGVIHALAAAGELTSWRLTPRGRLAEILVLDQFSRNMFREQRKAFAQDEFALKLAREAVANEADHKVDVRERTFFYMPYMHSEDTAAHVEAVRLFSQPGLEGNLDFEFRHKAIIDRFGRYPHRNKILGRISTPEETDFLKSNPGF